MTGTAATMGIEENLAHGHAAAAGPARGAGACSNARAPTCIQRAAAAAQASAWRGALTSKVRLLSGGQRQALTLLMAALQHPEAAAAGRAHRRARPEDRRARCLTLTEKIVAEQRLTALIVTHNMKDAIAMGNRLIMMNAGRIVVDVRGEERKKLTREDLMQLFEKAAGQEIENDRMLLS